MMLAQREFSFADQERFAAFSGDSNPMHMDPLRARRTQAGAPVVHGIHLLLWALDSLVAAQPGLPPLRSIRVQFNGFVYLGERADVVLAQQGPTRVRLNVSVNDAPRSKITVDLGDAVDECPIWSATSLEPVPPLQSPMNLDFETMADCSGQVPLSTMLQDAAVMFPEAANWIGTQRVAALAATTYLVGMVCPGLHSIYGGLALRTCTNSGVQNSLAYRVVETDSRYRSIEQEIAGGGFSGALTCFARTPPVAQPTMSSLTGLVGPTEFEGSLALIVGGSRGLGELTAKLIAAGGGRVIVTWQSGRDDAERVAQDIRSAGGVCETLAYDARNSPVAQLAPLTDAPTHAYYFATPAIFRPQADIFAAEKFAGFLMFYVDGFWKLSQTLRALRPNLSLFYPSSVSVAERPKLMTEYSMAKAAGELLCADMNASLAPMHVTVSRLPRLLTDQTASVTHAETADPLETMLPIVREVQSWPR